MFLSNSQVQKRYSVSRSTLWRWIKDGKIPAPRDFHGMKRWSVQELEDWEAKHN